MQITPTIFRLALALVFLLPVQKAVAQKQENVMDRAVIVLESAQGIRTPFYPATSENLSKAYLRLSMVDIKSDALIDDFAALNLCRLYTRYHDDEFAWREARNHIMRSVEKSVSAFPVHLYLNSTVRLGRYDFGTGRMTLNEQDKFKKVGLFRLQAAPYGDCNSVKLNTLPSSYSLRLINPVTLDSIPLPERAAFSLLNRMRATNNDDREVYITFFIKLNDIITNYSQEDKNQVLRSEIRGQLISLRFFADPERKLFIYDHVPESVGLPPR